MVRKHAPNKIRTGLFAAYANDAHKKPGEKSASRSLDPTAEAYGTASDDWALKIETTELANILIFFDALFPQGSTPVKI